jgi:hypothetical protein
MIVSTSTIEPVVIVVTREESRVIALADRLAGRVVALPVTRVEQRHTA